MQQGKLRGRIQTQKVFSLTSFQGLTTIIGLANIDAIARPNMSKSLQNQVTQEPVEQNASQTSIPSHLSLKPNP
jgi:hypothetical protein